MKSVALAGNPNCGKSTLFTSLTGVYQKTNNYPGVTVDKKECKWTLRGSMDVNLVDLPGLYSLYPEREDENISYKEIVGLSRETPFDLIVVTIDASNLKRNLLLLTQLQDMQLPLIVALTMTDVAEKRGIKIDKSILSYHLNLPVIEINAIRKKGLVELTNTIQEYLQKSPDHPTPKRFSTSLYDLHQVYPPIASLRSYFPNVSDYAILHRVLYHDSFYAQHLQQECPQVVQLLKEPKIDKSAIQSQLIMQRYKKIDHIVQACETHKDKKDEQRRTDQIDRLLLHPFWGYIFLVIILLSSFQLLFSIADIPMQMIDAFFMEIGGWMRNAFPSVWWSRLLVDGIWSGLSGIAVFIPQIAMLFLIISILEGSGYIARVNFLMDRWTRAFGLSGKSVIVFANAFACAVPAIMSTRNIESKKERLITILIAPYMACSARLPVYFTLISLLTPEYKIGGFVSIRALIMLGLYLFGIVVALMASTILRFLIRKKEVTIFLQELPVYRLPYIKNMLRDMYSKSRVFAVEAGKIIMVISIVIWGLSSFGPSTTSMQTPQAQETSSTTIELEDSYMGHLGRLIEPAIQPLGYDWKIGIALLTSFVAREVFVGTLSTIYAVGDADNNLLITKMKDARRQDGTPVYTVEVVISLLLFYALAMQCMSTFVVVYKETGSLKYPIVQLFSMTFVAYLMAWIGYTLASLL